MRAWLALVVLMVLAMPASARAEGVRPDGTCAPSDLLYNCSPSQLAELDRQFIVSPEDALDRPGPDVVRVLFSDQNGSPRLRIDAQRVGANGVQFTVFQGRPFWQTPGISQSRVFQRPEGWVEFAALTRAVSASAPDTSLLLQAQESLCLDPDGFLIQTRASNRRIVRFRNDCDSDDLMEQAWAALEQVAKAIPGCTLIESKRFGRVDHQIYACMYMAGADPVGEAAVLERLSDPALDLESGATLRPMFFPKAQVHWADQEYVGLDDAERLFRTRVLEADSVSPNFWEIRGGRNGVVVVKGSLWREGEGGVRYVTPFSQSWRRDDTGLWRIFVWWLGRERLAEPVY